MRDENGDGSNGKEGRWFNGFDGQPAAAPSVAVVMTERKGAPAALDATTGTS
jgi:hypothetical protein